MTDLLRSIGITDGTLTMTHSPLRGEVITIEEKTKNKQNLFKRTAVYEEMLILDEERYAKTVGPPKGELNKAKSAGERKGGADEGKSVEQGKAVDGDEGKNVDEETVAGEGESAGKGNDTDKSQGGDKGKGIDKGKAVDRESAVDKVEHPKNVGPTCQRGKTVEIHASRVRLDQLSDERLREGWVTEMATQGLVKVRVQGFEDGERKWCCETVHSLA